MTSIPSSEFVRARRWREGLGLSGAELAEQLGYSRIAIYWFEAGTCPPVAGKYKPIKPWVWHRYRLACAGLAAQLVAKKKFEWR